MDGIVSYCLSENSSESWMFTNPSVLVVIFSLSLWLLLIFAKSRHVNPKHFLIINRQSISTRSTFINKDHYISSL